MTTISNLILKTAIGSYGNTKALKDGTVQAQGITFDFIEISPVNRAFRPMVERLEFDVSEMALTTYMMAKSFDKQMTALPIVLVRMFHHGTILCNVRAGIRPNRKAIEALAQFSFEQRLLPKRYSIEELFDPSEFDMH
jgi:hypothetical protein